MARSIELGRILRAEYFVAVLLVLSTYAWMHWRYQHDEVAMRSLSLGVLVGGRTSAPPPQKEALTTWEWRIGIVCATMAAWRVFNSTSSLHGACFTVLGFAQLFVIVMAFLVDGVLCGLYSSACVLAFLLLEQPQVDEPQEVEVLTPITLKEKARDPATAEPGVAYLVFLHAPWSMSSQHAFSTFADLATQYSTDRVRFARLDVGEWSHVALQLGIDASPGSSFLPSVVLFENGQELARVPRGSGKSNALELRKENIVRAFELDMRYATSMHQRRPPAAATDSAAEDKQAAKGNSHADKLKST